MSSHYAKPENALRKAEDFVNVGKESEALKTLHGILVSRRYRAWQSTHEKIIIMYIELAVKLRKNMKDALVQYRMICQQSNMASLEKVVSFYQELSEKKVKEAEEKLQSSGNSKEVVAAINDDEDEEDTPESILRAAESGQESQSRADRHVLTPWLKYLWETYRTILEVLRNNAKLEIQYQSTARRAFEFCQQYKRNTAFRRLCEILRNHLATIAKHQQQPNAVDLNSPETQKLYLETRFRQLEIASQLELWQEAYRTIEDIHENMELSKIPPEPALMLTYYRTLAQIFWASENFLFHAYSMEKLYVLTLSANPNTSAEEKRALASRAMLATLCVPPTERNFVVDDTFDAMDEGNLRLANLLGFKKEVPTRSRLLSALVRLGLVKEVEPSVAKIYHLLENSFGPLTLYSQLKPLLDEKLKDAELGRYLEPLQRLTVLRVLQQLARVFRTVRLETFYRISPAFHTHQIERIVMEAVRTEQVSVRIDHQRQALYFSEDRMESDRLRTQLSVLSTRLSKVYDMVAPTNPQTEAAQREHVFTAILADVETEHKEVFERQQIIEKRKQHEEKAQIEREQKEAAERTAAAKKRAEEEKQRLAQESERRRQEQEQEKKKIEQSKKALQVKSDIEKKIAAVVPVQRAQKVLSTVSEIISTQDDTEAWIKAQNDLLEKERQDKERTFRENARRHDYLVRAMRIEERPLLIEAMEKQRIEDREKSREQSSKLAETAKAAHARALLEKQRLSRMMKVREEFASRVMSGRQRVFEKEHAAQQERLKKYREIQAKEEERKRKEEEEQEREMQRQRQIEEQREAEEARKRAADDEVRRAKQAEQAERQRKLDEAAAKQRAREAEVEAKEREERERRLGGSSSGARREEAPLRRRDDVPLRRGGDDVPPRRGGDDGPVRRSEDAPVRRGDDSGAAGDRERPWGRSSGAAPAAPGGPRRPVTRGEDDDAAGDRPPRRFGDRDAPREPSRFGGDRDAPSRDSGSRFGGDRDAPSRDSGSRFGGDRDRESRFGPRGGDDRLPRRGGDDDRPAPRRFDDREAGPRRGGDDREAGPRRGGDDAPPRRDPWRRDNEDRSSAPPARRGGDDREAPMRRGQDAPSDRPVPAWSRRAQEERGRAPEPARGAGEAEEQPGADQEQDVEDDGFTVVNKSKKPAPRR